MEKPNSTKDDIHVSMDITEKTRVSLFAVICAIPTLAFTIYWVTLIYEQTAEASRINVRQDTELVHQAQNLDAIKEMIFDIRERTIRIEERLRRIKN